MWGLATPGDLFANGNPLLYPTLLLATGVGAWVGFRLNGSWVRGLILAALAGALWFHLFVPDGWWATPPPGWERQAAGPAMRAPSKRITACNGSAPALT